MLLTLIQPEGKAPLSGQKHREEEFVGTDLNSFVFHSQTETHTHLMEKWCLFTFCTVGS